MGKTHLRINSQASQTKRKGMREQPEKEVMTHVDPPPVAKSPTQLKNNFKGITAMLMVPPPMTNHRNKCTCRGSGIRQTEDVEIVCTAHFYRFYFYLTSPPGTTSSYITTHIIGTT